jgi:hypothetical protein
MMELDCPGLASDSLDQIETNLGLLNPTKVDLLPIAPLSYLRSTEIIPRQAKWERSFLRQGLSHHVAQARPWISCMICRWNSLPNLEMGGQNCPLPAGKIYAFIHRMALRDI